VDFPENQLKKSICGYQVKILVCVSAGSSAASTGQVSGKFGIGDICENLARNLGYGIKSVMKS
jgi:hypothetical protein